MIKFESGFFIIHFYFCGKFYYNKWEDLGPKDKNIQYEAYNNIILETKNVVD